jgi:hypothetical protein
MPLFENPEKENGPPNAEEAAPRRGLRKKSRAENGIQNAVNFSRLVALSER